MIAQILNSLGLAPRADAAASKLAQLKEGGAKLEQAVSDASKVLTVAQTEVGELQRRLSEAEGDYADEPTERRAGAVRAAREALELARLRSRKPQAAVDAAQRAFDAWRAEVATSEAELEEEQRAARLVALRERATLDDFEARAAAPRVRLRTALAELEASANEITQLWRSTNEAARKLTAAGEPTTELADFHLVAPLVLAQAERRPDMVSGLLTDLHKFGHVCRDHGNALAPTFRGPLFVEIEKARGQTRPELQAVVLKQLRAALASRTLADATEAAAAFGDELFQIGESARAEEERVAAEQHAAENDNADDGTSVEPSGDEVVTSIGGDGSMPRTRATQAADLDERRAGNGERNPMGRTRAHLAASAADSHFTRIAPPADHFDRLNN